MDSLLLLVLVAAGVAPLAILGGWLTGHGWSDLGPLVQRGDDAAWRQAVMPWPRGVQEEDGVHWRTGPESPTEPSDPSEPSEADAADRADGTAWSAGLPDLVECAEPLGSSVRPSRIHAQVRLRHR